MDEKRWDDKFTTHEGEMTLVKKDEEKEAPVTIEVEGTPQKGKTYRSTKAHHELELGQTCTCPDCTNAAPND